MSRIGKLLLIHAGIIALGAATFALIAGVGVLLALYAPVVLWIVAGVGACWFIGISVYMIFAS